VEKADRVSREDVRWGAPCPSRTSTSHDREVLLRVLPGRADDISRAVVYLASDESRYLTGNQLRVDAAGYLKVNPFRP
jgi:NAD(P)-dependent dehydrogenase (short-subunit alcohol dehydrogenase family)